MTPTTIKSMKTLSSLTTELQRIFKFRYLVVGDAGIENNYLILLYKTKPRFGTRTWWSDKEGDQPCFFSQDLLKVELDLSEYRDPTGRIDFSKCIIDTEENK